MARWFAIFSLIVSSCSSNKDYFSDLVDLEISEFVPVESFSSSHSLSLMSEIDGVSSVQFVGCGIARPLGTFILYAPSHVLLAKPGSCSTHIPQAFLQEGFEVAIFNEPDQRDFGGQKSQRLFSSSIGALKSLHPKIPITGIWVYGVSSISGLFGVKHLEAVPTMIVGGGVYDVENVSKRTKDSTIKKLLADLRAEEGEAFAEKRSIAWDPSGLPKKLFLYHGDADEVFPKESARSFRDSFSTSGHSVDIMFIPEMGHVISSEEHFATLTEVLKKLFKHEDQ